MRVARRSAALLLVALGCAGTAGGGAPGAAPAAAPAAVDSDATPAAPGGTFVYVGMAGGEIATLRLDPATGGLARRGTVSAGRAPASLVRSAEREVVVAVDETTGLATSFSVDAKSGALTPVGRGALGAPSSGATVDATGKYVLAAQRGGGRVGVLAITPNGGLEPIDTFAAGAGASAVVVQRAYQVALVSNFRAGSVSQFTFNTGTGMLTPKAGPPLSLPAGSGPTRLAIHPSGRWIYVLNETTDAISVQVFDEDLKALSALSSQIVSTLPEGAPRGKSRPADLVVRGDGRFVYATNRGADSVATFAVEPGGTLKLVGHEPSGGHAAGAIAVDPSGAYLVVANEGSRSLAVFHLDAATGVPGGRRTIALPAPPISLLIAQGSR
jgi:6-phosphogluconolactonase